MFKRWLSIKPDKSALIIGPRRSGKTTLLKNQFSDYKYITLDDFDYLTWASRDPKGLIESVGKKVIIDEIQRKPELTVAVKYAIDNQDSIFIMTGSSSIGLLDSASDSLAGRINLYSLPTACFGENTGKPSHGIFAEEVNSARLKEAQRKLSEALEFGQFPEVLNQKKINEKQELLENYKNTYFIRDLMQISNLENLNGLITIFNHLARSIGSHLEVSNFSREAGLSFQTTKKYLNTLYQSHLAFNLYGYQFGPAKKFIKAAKTYFADNGIIRSLKIPLNEGQLLENFVIAEIEKRRKLGFLKCDWLYYYKSAAGREIDLIFETENDLYAIEIKSTTNPSKRDVKNLKEFSQNLNRSVKQYLFYPGDEYSMIDDVKIIPVAALFCGI